jgi:sugar-specific transcriptional regulator TrmB
MNQSILKKLGLSDKEVAIYIKLLEYGAISVRGLADISGVNRGTTYDILKELQDKGLVSYYHTDTKQKFVAEKPEKILELIRKKEEELGDVREQAERVIPELKALARSGQHNPVTRFYDGKKGIRSILEDVLVTMSNVREKEYYIYSAKCASEDMNIAYPNFTKARIKKQIRVKSISLAQGGGTHGLDERRWLGCDDETATFIMLYGGKCAYISRDAKGDPVGVIIENSMIYETQKIIFFSLWKTLNTKNT